MKSILIKMMFPIALGIYLIVLGWVFFPGFITQDVTGSLRMAYGLQPMGDVIPMLIHILVRLFTDLQNGVIYLLVLNLCVALIVFCYGRFFWRRLFPEKVWIGNVVIWTTALYPSTAISILILDKDTLYGLSAFAFLYSLISIIFLTRQASRLDWIFYAVCGVFLSFLRQNGPHFVIACSLFCVVVLFWKKSAQRFRFLIIFFPVFILGLKGPKILENIYGNSTDYFSPDFTLEHLLVHDYYTTLILKRKKNVITPEIESSFKAKIEGFEDFKSFKFDIYNSDSTRNLTWRGNPLQSRRELATESWQFLKQHPIYWINTKRHYANALLTSNYAQGVMRVWPNVGTEEWAKELAIQFHSEMKASTDNLREAWLWWCGHTLQLNRANHWASYYIWNYKPFFYWLLITIPLGLWLRSTYGQIALWSTLAVVGGIWLPHVLISGYNQYKYFWASHLIMPTIIGLQLIGVFHKIIPNGWNHRLSIRKL